MATRSGSGINLPVVYPDPPTPTQTAPSRSCGQHFSSIYSAVVRVVKKLILLPFSCCKCSCCCISIIGVVIFIFGFMLLWVWIGLSPRDPGIYIDRAFITRFNLSAPTTKANYDYTIDYNITVDFELRNSNKKQAICYDWIGSSLYYDNQRVAWVQLPSFCQGHKNTSFVTAGFAGRSSVKLSPSGAGFYAMQNMMGSFIIDVEFYGRFKTKMESAKYWRYHPDDLDSMCSLLMPKAGLLSGIGCQDIRPKPGNS